MGKRVVGYLYPDVSKNIPPEACLSVCLFGFGAHSMDLNQIWHEPLSGPCGLPQNTFLA